MACGMYVTKSLQLRMMSKYTMPDQPARFAKAVADGNKRVIALVESGLYNPKNLKGKTIVVTGGNRGLGKAIVEELVSLEANVYVTSRKPATMPGVKAVIDGIEVTDDKCGDLLADKLKKVGVTSVDVLINNAGYFPAIDDSISTSLNFQEEIKMIDICAVGPLRVTGGLVQNDMLPNGSKVAMITSQGGSIEWRPVQNANEGGDYGHHMSKAAANMMTVLVQEELKKKGICVAALHPGFNKTDMTKKYEHIWEIEGAVDPSLGAKRVAHEIERMYLEPAEMEGAFINCEDGMNIPW
jgi:NAD(P)-dependent dehydrogenase (short-subunit alcohol dehydrogenase family)